MYFQIMVGMLYHTVCVCISITHSSFLRRLLPNDRWDLGVSQTLLVCYILLNPQSKPDMSKSAKFSLIFVDKSFGDSDRYWGDWRYQVWRYWDKNSWSQKMLLKQERENHGAWRSLVPAADLALISVQMFTFYFVSKIHFRKVIWYSRGFFLHSNLKYPTSSKCWTICEAKCGLRQWKILELTIRSLNWHFGTIPCSALIQEGGAWSCLKLGMLDFLDSPREALLPLRSGWRVGCSGSGSTGEGEGEEQG